MSAGNDLNDDITPVEASLTWTIGKTRREACNFVGGEVGCLLCPRAQQQSLCNAAKACVLPL